MSVEPREGWRRPAAIAVAVAIACGLPSLGGGFVIDDAGVVVDNPSLRDLGNVPGFFLERWGGGLYYRPLARVLHALEYAAFGLEPAGWRATSLALYALTAGLVAILIARVTRRERAALAGGALFAALPVHAEVMAPACYQTSLLCGLFAVLALLAVAGPDGRLDRRPRRLLLAALATALGLGAKEEAAVVPFLIGAWWALERPAGRPRRLAAAALLGALVAGSALAVALRDVADVRVTFFAGLDGATVVRTMLRVATLYVELLVLPLRLTPFYDWTIVPPAASWSLDALAGLGLVAALGAAVWAAAPRAPAVALGLAWIPLGLLPYLQIVPLVVVAAERALYLPSVGFCLALGALLDRGLGRLAPRPARLAGAAAALAIAGYGARTAVRLGDWRDDRTLNEATAAAFPETPVPLLNLARLHQKAGRRAEALVAIDEAIRRAPAWTFLEGIKREIELSSRPRRGSGRRSRRTGWPLRHRRARAGRPAATPPRRPRA